MSLVNALEDFLSSLQILVIRGDVASRSPLGPLSLAPCTRRPHDIRHPGRCRAAARACGEDARQPDTVAYLCTGMTCSAPLTELEHLVRAFKLRIKSA